MKYCLNSLSGCRIGVFPTTQTPPLTFIEILQLSTVRFPSYVDFNVWRYMHIVKIIFLKEFFTILVILFYFFLGTRDLNLPHTPTTIRWTNYDRRQTKKGKCSPLVVLWGWFFDLNRNLTVSDWDTTGIAWRVNIVMVTWSQNLCIFSCKNFMKKTKQNVLAH